MLVEGLISTPITGTRGYPCQPARKRLLRSRLDQQVLGELHIQASDRSPHRAQVAAVLVVADGIGAAVEAAQLDFASKFRSVKSVVHAAVFANGVGFRAVE